MSYLKDKAKNFFILGIIAEKLEMYSEAASNYFKALFAVDDFELEKINLSAKDHTERFALLKENLPDLYEISDKLFLVYRRTYTAELSKEEVKRVREQIKKAFSKAKIEINDEEFKEKTKKISEE